MKPDSLVVLLSCHSLDDFPVYHQGLDAESLLAGWSALWHPELLAAVGKMPTWWRADSPPEEFGPALVMVPPVVEPQVPATFFEQATERGCHLSRGLHRRDDIVAALLAAIRQTDLPSSSVAITLDAELAQDFLALGHCYLQTELLTRRMRHLSNIDEEQFEQIAVAGAIALVQGNNDQARDYLSRAFNLLGEARQRIYPIDCNLLDVTLVTSTTLGADLVRELNSEIPTSLLIPSEMLATLKSSHPQTFDALEARIQSKTLTIVSGEHHEQELPLLTPETILLALRRGRGDQQQTLDQVSTIYGRRTFGLTPLLPQLLSELGYTAALHWSLDEGHLPRCDYGKIRWEGVGYATIDALARLPLDAADPEALLGLSEKLGETTDYDQVSTIAFAHWPDRVCTYYEDLRRMARYAPALGKFVTLEDYFADTDPPHDLTKHTADDYRSPYLQQAVRAAETGIIESRARRLQQQATREAASIVSAMSQLVRGTPDKATEFSTAGDEMHQATQSLAKSLDGAPSSAESLLLANPFNFARRVVVEVNELSRPPRVAGPVKAVSVAGDKTLALVDLPGLGFAWINPNDGVPSPSLTGKPIANDNVLENGFCQVMIDKATGGIGAIYDYQTRGNRLSQRLVFRTRREASPATFWDLNDEQVDSTMVCESLDVSLANALRGEIVSTGRLIDSTGRELARFRQRFRLDRESRLLDISIRVEPLVSVPADPWNAHLASRWAWGESAAQMYRGLHLGRHDTSAKRIETPYYVEMVEGRSSLAIIAAGVPFHRKVGGRMLDTILVPQGQESVELRLGVAIGSPRPWNAALEMLSPLALCSAPHSTSALSEGWLLHLGAKNLSFTALEPLAEEDRVVGFTARIAEVEGRPAPLKLRCFRPLVSANRTNFLGEYPSRLEIDDGAAVTNLAAYEWLQITARFV